MLETVSLRLMGKYSHPSRFYLGIISSRKIFVDHCLNLYLREEETDGLVRRMFILGYKSCEKQEKEVRLSRREKSSCNGALVYPTGSSEIKIAN